MNEEYLWDRRGSDPEIAGLEATLGVFRASSHRAPKIPRARETWTTMFGSFGLRTAAATFATIAMMIFAGFLYLDLGTDAANVSVPAQLSDGPVTEAVPRSGADLALRAAEEPEAAVTGDNKVEEVAVSTAHRAPAKTKKVPLAVPKPKERLEGFSDEEKAAYEQLMLALSITSSSFRMVQDKLGANSGGIPLVGRETDTIRSN